MNSIILHDDTPQKRCNKCKQEYPATHDYFYRDKNKAYGLSNICKACRKAYDKPLREITPPAPGEEKQCSVCKQKFPATSQYFTQSIRTADGLCAGCKTCRYASKKSYRASPKGQTWSKQYYIDNRDEIRTNQNQYEKEHPEKSRERHRRNRQAKIEHYREKQKEYVQSEKGKVVHQSIQKRYRQTEHGKIVRKTCTRNYFARKKQSTGYHTPEQIQDQLKRQKNTCYYCKKKLGKGKRAYHVDHIMPLARGGSNGPDNLVIACPTCNCSKRDRPLHEWHQGGRLL